MEFDFASIYKKFANALIFFAIGTSIIKCSDYMKNKSNENGSKKFSSGDYTGAISEYNKALFFDFGKEKLFSGNGNAAIYTSLCGAKINSGKYKEALKDCDRSIDIDASLLANYINRCLANDNLGNYKQAIKDCQQVISLDQSNVKAYAAICRLKHIIGENEGALVACNKALEIDSKNEVAYRNRCSTNTDLGNYQNALQDCRKALDINPEDKLPFLLLCRNNIVLENYNLAIKQCDVAVNYLSNKQSSNTIQTAYLLRGVAYGLTNNTKLACSDWKEASNLGADGATELIDQNCK